MNDVGSIKCDTVEEFYDAVEALVKRGLVFRADVGKLTITLTGGY